MKHQPGKVDKETHEAELGMTQKILAEKRVYPKPRSAGSCETARNLETLFEWTELDINKISIVLQWGKQGRDKLRYAIYPELVCYDAALENREGIVRLNYRLQDHGFPLIETKI